MVSKDVKLSLRTQCNLLEVHRSLFYKVPSSRKDDTEIANKLAEIYQKYPAYGYRRITTCLHRQGIAINRKCVLRLMRKMGLKAIYPGSRTTQSQTQEISVYSWEYDNRSTTSSLANRHYVFTDKLRFSLHERSD